MRGVVVVLLSVGLLSSCATRRKSIERYSAASLSTETAVANDTLQRLTRTQEREDTQWLIEIVRHIDAQTGDTAAPPEERWLVTAESHRSRTQERASTATTATHLTRLHSDTTTVRTESEKRSGTRPRGILLLAAGLTAAAIVTIIVKH